MAHSVMEEWETGGYGMQNWECGIKKRRGGVEGGKEGDGSTGKAETRRWSAEVMER